MSNILCVYYSRTGRTEQLMNEIAQELGCEIVKLEDGVKRGGLFGWLYSGMQAMARKLPPVHWAETKLPLNEYDLIVIGTPVWAGRCSAPVRSFLREYGEELPDVAYLITRGSDVRYEEVFDQMDFYVREPHVAAVTIRPHTVGSHFWEEDFLTSIRNTGKEKQENAQQAESH